MKKDLDSTHVFQNGTGQQIIKSLDGVAKNLSTMAIAKSSQVDITNYRHIQRIVQLGLAKEYFQIGDQITTTWSIGGETEYGMPWDVVDFGPVTDPDGVVHENAMWLESHYALPIMRFDQSEAFYVALEEMPAGTYHFSFNETITSIIPANTPIMFTLTKAVPSGGMLILGTGVNDVAPLSAPMTDWRVRVYANGAQADPDEVVEVSQGDDGTDLGIISINTPYGQYGLNNTYRLYGYNRWSQSAIRQWLNSDKPAGEWWKQQNPFDRGPEQRTTIRGFMACLPAEFLTIVKPVKVATALNTLSDKVFGESETTIDRFFLASLEQEYVAPRWHGEGKAFKYWVDRLGMEHKTGSANKRAEHIRYIITNYSYATNVRFRSATIDRPSSVYRVGPDGTVSSPFACNAYGSCPCCVIY